MNAYNRRKIMSTIKRLFFACATATALPILLTSCVESPEPKQAPQADVEQATDEPNICQTQTVTDEDSPCQPYRQEELCQPKEFAAVDGVLQTRLVVEKKWQCVPALSEDTWVMAPKLLRNYGASYASKTNWNYPAPTFRLKRKISATAPTKGDTFKMVLTNNLGPTTVPEQKKCFEGVDPPRFRNDRHPNCFHGNETTNFHFHGFHISPQPLQDYVLLKLYPKDTPGITNYRSSMTNEELKGFSSIGGSYRYDLDPLPYNQPEGTHWYHAHHHGATAMQVINGMAGTFIIEGPFDKWLNDFYGYDASGKPKLTERILVIQQINDQLQSSTPLVNGQGNPKVSIQPGEVQRWRFVSATTQASAQLEVFFGDLEVRQIQMDGVQFGPENYRRQPLLKDNKFELSPGNRADFLVRIPIEAKLSMDQFQVTQRVVGSVGEEVQDKIDEQKAAMRRFMRADQPDMLVPTEIPLMTISKLEAVDTEMTFPPSMPALPEFLTPPKPGETKEIDYQMFQPAGNDPAPVFKIDGQQVRDCVPDKMTMTLGSDEQWVVRNRWNDGPALTRGPDGNRGIAHPFHIHTNPFYVVRNGKHVYTNKDDGFANGIWQDTIRLPLAEDAHADKDRASSVDLFMEFEDYTGGYVQHCHILGHEDRGMMTLVQTLCPETSAFGTPVAGAADNCKAPLSPLPICR